MSDVRSGAARLNTFVTILASVAALALQSCGQGSGQQAQSTADDALIAAQVRAKAAAIDAATLTLVHVSCENGTVTLTGTIASAKERSGIEEAARGVQGVQNVDDRISVDRNAPTGAQVEQDLALAARIHGALAAQTGVNAARIHVDVHRGVVTLTGTLPSTAHRQVADETVRGVSGVARLIDNITIAK